MSKEFTETPILEPNELAMALIIQMEGIINSLHEDLERALKFTDIDSVIAHLVYVERELERFAAIHKAALCIRNA